MILQLQRRYIVTLVFLPSLLFAYSGSGTADDPFQIATAKQLDSIRYYLGAKDSTTSFKIMNDIDLTEYLLPGNPGYDSGKFWSPIGEFPEDNSFFGKVEGNNHTISGLKIKRATTDCVGLFGSIGYKGILQNIGLEIAVGDTVKGNGDVGGLVGCSRGTVHKGYFIGTVSGSNMIGGLVGINYGTVSNGYAAGSVSSNCGMIGGLVGKNFGIVNNSYASSTVSGYSETGGLVGMNEGAVYNSYAIGAVSGNAPVGGLIGNNCSYATISNSHATGAVNGTFDVGGLVGSNSGIIRNSYAVGAVGGTKMIGGIAGVNYFGQILNSYATGAVTGNEYIGGMVGLNCGLVSNSYTTGMVSGGNFCGGLIGVNNGTVSNTYSTGAVSVSSYCGGLVGLNQHKAITNSFWDKQTTHYDTSSGSNSSCGKTTSEMKTKLTFSSWDFDTTWAIAEDKNNGYPYLQWQVFPSAKLEGPPPRENGIHLDAFMVSGGKRVLRYTLTKACIVQATLFDLSGRAIDFVDAGTRPAGWHTLVWKDLDGREAAGTFLVRIRVGEKRYTKMLVLFR